MVHSLFPANHFLKIYGLKDAKTKDYSVVYIGEQMNNKLPFILHF